jgi:two-component system, OmpR family, alkaline phosphatase synthesis response regulator PhoP
MHRILIVEDDEFLADAYKEKLKKEFDVDVARDGQEVLDKIKVDVPDLIILDMVMPKRDGINVLQKLKKSEEPYTGHIIVSSNIDDPHTIEQAKKLGAEEYVVKCNISINELVDICHKTLGDS